MIAVVLLRRR